MQKSPYTHHSHKSKCHYPAYVKHLLACLLQGQFLISGATAKWCLAFDEMYWSKHFSTRDLWCGFCRICCFMRPPWYWFVRSAWRTGGEILVKLPAELAGADMGEVTLVLGEKFYLSLGKNRVWIWGIYVRDRYLIWQLAAPLNLKFLCRLSPGVSGIKTASVSSTELSH